MYFNPLKIKYINDYLQQVTTHQINISDQSLGSPFILVSYIVQAKSRPMESQYIWKPPTFDTSRQPTLAHESRLPSDPHFQENFARSAKWCDTFKHTAPYSRHKSTAR